MKIKVHPTIAEIEFIWKQQSAACRPPGNPHISREQKMAFLHVYLSSTESGQLTSRSSFPGSWTPLFSSISNREKLCCFSKPMPPLPWNTDSLVARREGTKAVREENTLLSGNGENRASLCFCTSPRALSLIWTCQQQFLLDLIFPSSQSTGYSPYCREHTARSHYYTGINTAGVTLEDTPP